MTQIQSIKAIAEQVVNNLSRCTSRGEFSIITTPILAYGHTFVPVHLAPNGNGVLISDGGFARREVSMMGGDNYFSANAHRVASKYGVRCDGDLFFSIEGHDALDAVTMAVAAIANAAKDTIEVVAERLADKSTDGAREQLFATLRLSFDRYRIHTGAKAKLVGATEEWEFDAVVDATSAKLAVIVVTPYSNAVTTAFSKFADLKGGVGGRRSFGVLTNKDSTPRLRLITNVATLVPIEQSTPAFWQPFGLAA